MDAELKKNLIVLASIGSSIGVVGGVIATSIVSTNVMADGHLYLCSRLLLENTGGNVLLAFLIQAVVMAVYGAVCMGGVVVYGIESWSLLRSTVTHFVVTILSFYVAAFLLGWLEIEINMENLLFFVVMVMIYFMIWLVNYLSYRSQVRKMNKGLELLKSAQHSR